MINTIKATTAFLASGLSREKDQFNYWIANEHAPGFSLLQTLLRQNLNNNPAPVLISIPSASKLPNTKIFYGLAFLVLSALSACESSKGKSTAVNEQIPVVKSSEEENTFNTPASPTPADTVAKAAVQADTVAPVKESTAAKTPDEDIETASSESVEWPVKGPAPLAGSILPDRRIIAFYGNPLSKRMGILGELPPDEMLAQLDREVAAWEKADPATPVQPALHVIVVTAQVEPGRDSKYRLRMTNKVSEQVLSWAEQRKAIVFLDIQIGHSTLQDELPRLAHFLKLPNVHLGIDAEFAMKDGSVPGKKMGVFDAADINYASSFLANLVTEHQIPPKVFVIHRFTKKMITNTKDIKLDPRVQIVMHMDGWGSPSLKKDTYRRYIYKEPVQFTGFKLFYKNDTRNGTRMMTPEEILKLNPKPLYIQYQ